LVAYTIPPADKAKLFDKDPTTTVTLPGKATWKFKCKTLFEVSKLKVVDSSLDYISGLIIRVLYPDKTYKEFTSQPVLLDTEIKWYWITNNTDVDIEVAEIIIEPINSVSLAGGVDKYFKRETDIALTNGFVPQSFGFISTSFDISNDDANNYIDWSWDGATVHGHLLKGETFGEQRKAMVIYLRGQAGGEKYRIWAR